MCRHRRAAQTSSSASATLAVGPAAGLPSTYSAPAQAMNTDHMPSTMLTSRRHRLTSQVANPSPAMRPSARKLAFRSNTGLGSRRGAAIARLDQQHLHVTEHALDEATLAIAEVVFPHADEGLVVTQGADARQVGAEV